MTSPDPVNPYVTHEAPAGPNTLARASFIIAIVLVVLAVVLQIVSRFAPVIAYDFQLGASALGILFGVFAFVNLILGAFGLVFGIIGARRPGLTLQAGIGIGVGGSAAITSFVSLVATPLMALFY